MATEQYTRNTFRGRGETPDGRINRLYDKGVAEGIQLHKPAVMGATQRGTTWTATGSTGATYAVSLDGGCSCRGWETGMCKHYAMLADALGVLPDDDRDLWEYSAVDQVIEAERAGAAAVEPVVTTRTTRLSGDEIQELARANRRDDVESLDWLAQAREIAELKEQVERLEADNDGLYRRLQRAGLAI